MDVAAKILEFIKLPTKLVFALDVVAAFLLFAPGRWQRFLSLEKIIVEYRAYIGGAFVILSVILLVEFIGLLNKKNKRRKNLAEFHQMQMQKIMSLDQHEKAVLREYFITGQNTMRMPIDDPTVSGLINAGILQVVGTIGRGLALPVGINPEILSFITFRLIGLPDDEPSQEQIEWLASNRPEFVERYSSSGRLW